MPELPEVETIANGVDARVRGARIVSVWTSGKPQTFKSPESEIEEVLTGATIDRVRRVGKTIVMTLERDADGGASPVPAEFLVHLGMTGRLLVAEGDVPLPAHTHAVLALADGREVRFIDPRRFGRLSVVHDAYAGPGLEPMTIGAEEFAALFKGRKIAIKAALLNQSLLHGVGNIYADESLFRAGIRPTRKAGRLTKAESERLRLALRKVLARAIELGVAFEFFEPDPDIVDVFTREVTLDELALEVGGTEFDEVGGLGVGESFVGVGGDQAGDEAHQQVVANDFVG